MEIEVVRVKKAITEAQRQANRDWQKRYYHEKVKNDPEAMQRRREIAYAWFLKQDHEAHCAKQREQSKERYYSAKEKA